MIKRILTVLMMILISLTLIGCSAGFPQDPDDLGDLGDLVDTLLAKITLGNNSSFEEINDIDIVRQLTVMLYGYNSQESLYMELSHDDYENLVSNYTVAETYYITLTFSNGVDLQCEVYTDGTVIKLKNDYRYLCQVLTDYDFIKGLQYFNDSLKNDLVYDKVNVSTFFNLFSSSFDEYNDSEYLIENCYRIYSIDLLINNDYQIFKFINNCASFLFYDNVIYELGPWNGGLGVVDIKLADLNNDSFDEVYFTYSWGSGTHWNGLSYFDTKDQTIHQLYVEKMYYQELMLTESDLGIIVSRAYFSSNATNKYAFIDLTLTKKSDLGQIIFSQEIDFEIFDI